MDRLNESLGCDVDPSTHHEELSHATMLRTGLVHYAWVLFLGLAIAACSSEPDTDSYVARVGDHYLTEEDLEEALESLPQQRDATEAREQVIEQWVHNTLLYEEALNRNLPNDPDVQRQLEESERSLLVSSMMSRLEDEAGPPSQEELREYFERNQDRMRLREPYVHVRYIEVNSRDRAEEARSQLQEDYQEEVADSTWPYIEEIYAIDPAVSSYFDETYYPERLVREQLPLFRDEISQMSEGDITPIEEHNDYYVFMQLVHRESAGSLPEFSWVEDEVRRMLEMESRKQTLARKVQELRNQAIAREHLDIPE